MALSVRRLPLLVSIGVLFGCTTSTDESPPPTLFGRVVFSQIVDGKDLALYSMTPEGTDIRLLKWVPGLSFVVPRISPDGQLIAAVGYVSQGGAAFPAELYILTWDGSSVNVLPNTEHAGVVTWSPDATRLAFACQDQAASPPENALAICLINPDGSGLQRVNHSSFATFMPAWSPDGQRLAYVSDSTGGDYDIFTMSLDGTDVQEVLDTPWGEEEPVWSPDGTRLAFWRDTPAPEIFVVQVSGTGEHQVTALEHATEPAWSNSGEEIWFNHLNQIYAIHPDGSGVRPVVVSPSSVWPTWGPP
ncbi:MAG TPA: hypothetical protein VLB12_00555 [Gemmatimonadales bacterium]|nr:hypothetical protein [Gemmatimonadales bacterium]